MSDKENIGTAEFRFNPFAAELIACPYAQYRRLQTEDPIHWNVPLQTWVLTSFDDIAQVVNDDSFEPFQTSKTIAEFGRRAGRDYKPLIRFLDAIPFLRSGEVHKRDRRTIAKVMNRLALSQIEKLARETASSLVSSLRPGAMFDGVTGFADPFPQLLMAQILGLPETDVTELNDLCDGLTLVFDPASLAAYDSANAKASAIFDFLAHRVRNRPSGALGLEIIYEAAPGAGEEKLESAVATTLFAYRVGTETSMALVGAILRMMADRPELRQKLQSDPKAVALFASEVLRLESSVQRVGRVATEARQLRGKQIEKGDRVLLLLGAANRDPLAFPCPDDLDLEQKRAGDLAFGGGSHFCLGASLALLEARVVTETFLELPPLRQTGPEKWYPGLTLRRLQSLPLEVGAVA